jgi:ParB family transcriptional regulator, chromosome partitioning protein
VDLLHIDIDRLVLSPANMRFRGKAPDLANILPSVRARGILVPLMLRQAQHERVLVVCQAIRRSSRASDGIWRRGGGQGLAERLDPRTDPTAFKPRSFPRWRPLRSPAIQHI